MVEASELVFLTFFFLPIQYEQIPQSVADFSPK